MQTGVMVQDSLMVPVHWVHGEIPRHALLRLHELIQSPDSTAQRCSFIYTLAKLPPCMSDLHSKIKWHNSLQVAIAGEGLPATCLTSSSLCSTMEQMVSG